MTELNNQSIPQHDHNVIVFVKDGSDFQTLGWIHIKTRMIVTLATHIFTKISWLNTYFYVLLVCWEVRITMSVLKVSREGHNITSIMFSFMHLLLKTANHVALLTPHTNSSPQQLKRTKEVCKVAFKDHPQFLEQSREASFRTLSDPKYCGKMKVS